MGDIKKLYDVTLRLKEVVEQSTTSKNRQDHIDEINKLVDERSELIKNITPPYREDETLLGKEIVALNVQIQAQMERLFQDLKLEMKQVKKQKKSNESYINPYKHIQTLDGLYMDRKK
ncbi:flagellar protein FliT [Virgibacillus soli]|uniref:Flagellar protein FliT n=1 Tax=Paracerasibacillus soli TaxID=480284 RepID=A0ABU5CTZ7_9BACI|nr:flagellar protein FliT [Virgibacillus soli]MDY0408910.1 flagellar protein FliT [Virgibacillus soli]